MPVCSLASQLQKPHPELLRAMPLYQSGGSSRAAFPLWGKGRGHLRHKLHSAKECQEPQN